MSFNAAHDKYVTTNNEPQDKTAEYDEIVESIKDSTELMLDLFYTQAQEEIIDSTKEMLFAYKRGDLVVLGKLFSDILGKAIEEEADGRL